MKVRFLLDENLSPRLKAALLRLNPAIDVIRLTLKPTGRQVGTCGDYSGFVRGHR